MESVEVGAMSSRLVVSIGTAITTFLAVTAFLTELLLSAIALSAVVAIPLGVVAGAVVGWATRARFWDDPDARPALAGGAAIGYALIATFLVGYAVPRTRGLVDVQTSVGIAGVVGVVVFLVVSRYPALVET